MGQLDGYEMVKDRITRFYERYPDGRLVTRSVKFVQIEQRHYVLVKALAYRTVDDPHPATGTAMDPIPGLNNFSRFSEVECAETSAIGRSLANLGMGGHIATVDEIQAKTTKPDAKPVQDLSVAATELIAWVSSEKVPADKIKLTLGAMGVAVGNKRLKTVLSGMTDEQIVSLRERLS